MKEDVLKQQETKVVSMEKEHSNWTVRHQAASDANRDHRHAVMEAERQHMVQLAKAEDIWCRQRLASLSSLETAAAEEMELVETVARESTYLLE